MIAECICFISEARILVAAMSASALTPGFRRAPRRLVEERSLTTVPGRSLLQLALQRFDFFGQRDILGDQRLDFAHGVQDGGVIAAPKPAPDFG